MKLNNLLNNLEKLIDELNKSGKTQSADFFIMRYNEITKYKENISDELIKELSTCRAMAQYADFSFAEENLLETVVLCANALLKETS